MDATVDLLRQPIIGLHVVADELQIDRRGHAEVQNLADDVGGLKEELRAGKLLGQALAELVDVILGGHGVICFQTDQDFGIGFADHARIAVGGVDGAVEQADVVENAVEIAPAG